MKPVMQTAFTIPDPELSHEDWPADTGNCLQACIASIFEVELNTVPNFIMKGSSWWESMTTWTLKHSQVVPHYIPTPKGNYPQNSYYMASFPSPARKEGDTVSQHVLIMLNGQIVHDTKPYHTGTFTGDPEDIIVFCMAAPTP